MIEKTVLCLYIVHITKIIEPWNGLKALFNNYSHFCWPTKNIPSSCGELSVSKVQTKCGRGNGQDKWVETCTVVSCSASPSFRLIHILYPSLLFTYSQLATTWRNVRVSKFEPRGFGILQELLSTFSVYLSCIHFSTWICSGHSLYFVKTQSSKFSCSILTSVLLGFMKYM